MPIAKLHHTAHARIAETKPNLLNINKLYLFSNSASHIILRKLSATPMPLQNALQNPNLLNPFNLGQFLQHF